MSQDQVQLVPNGGWDARLLICRCAPTVDSFMLITERYLVIIDTLLNPETAETLLSFARPYLTDRRQLLVVNTHADWDHCWGNQLFTGANPIAPAPILASSHCATRFATEMAATLQRQQTAEPARFRHVQPVGPTITFDHHLTIDGGDLTLELFPAPGHTEDHLAIFVPELALLLAGDAAEAPFPFADTVEGLRVLRATLGTLMARNPQSAFYCHAPVHSGPALLAQNLAYFARLEAACRTAHAQGVVSTVADERIEQDTDVLFDSLEGAAELSANLREMYLSGHRQHLRLLLQTLEQEAAE